MPGTGNYSGSNVDSTYLFDVGVALYQLQDNTSQLIDPKDIRDSVWTLWNRIDDVQIIASMSATSSFFTNAAPTTVTVGGIPAGSTFPGTYSLKQMFDLLLYPYTPPVLSIVASNTIRQYGSGLSVNLDWSVQKKAQNITSILVEGYTETIAGGGAVNQSGTRTINATHSLNYGTLSNETQTFTMSVTDASSAVQTRSTSINWRHKMYWGRINLSSLGSLGTPGVAPNLFYEPGKIPQVASLCTDPLIRNLSGAGVSTGSALASNYERVFDGINGAGQHLVIAFPTAFKVAAGNKNPNFIINQANVDAWSKVRDNSPLVTDTGITVPYDVWVSHTLQSGTINSFRLAIPT